MWVELVTQEKNESGGGRLLINLDTAFCFQENPDGTTNAVSITGVAVPVAVPYETVKTDILNELG